MNSLLAQLVPMVVLCLVFQSLAAETMEDRLCWAPVAKRSHGNPTVVVKRTGTSTPKVVFFRPANRVIVKVPSGYSKAQVNTVLKRHFLNLLWEEYLDDDALTYNEQRLNMGELIPMDRSTFFRIGHYQLSGCSTGNPVHDAWWKVRMGCDLNESNQHLLAVVTLAWDDPTKKSFGHYAIALRERGGNPMVDSTFDFRAPWHHDRRPRLSEAPNVHNRLKLKALRENLYDWLYTQTEYRNSHVEMGFLKIHCEQVCLLKAFRGSVHQAGNFRVFKKNCASLGTQFMNRLLPLDEVIGGEDSFADLPYKAYDRTIEAFGGTVETVRIENCTREIGRKPTSRSDLHAAEPSRAGSRPFQILSGISAIN